MSSSRRPVASRPPGGGDGVPQVERLTISIGYCQAMQDILPVEVLSRADRSLYQAKQDGRNRVHSYHDLLAAGIFNEQVCAEAEFF